MYVENFKNIANHKNIGCEIKKPFKQIHFVHPSSDFSADYFVSLRTVMGIFYSIKFIGRNITDIHINKPNSKIVYTEPVNVFFYDIEIYFFFKFYLSM